MIYHLIIWLVLIGASLGFSQVADSSYYNNNVKPIFQSTCSCHFIAGEGMVHFEINGYALGMAGQASSKYYEFEDINDLTFVPFITPGKLDSSLLYIKVAYTPADNDFTYLNGNDSGDKIQMGSRMPAGGPYLSLTQIETVGKWILLAGGVDTNTYTSAPTGVWTKNGGVDKKMFPGPIKLGQKEFVLPTHITSANLYKINGVSIQTIVREQKLRLNQNQIYFIRESK